MEYGKMGKWLVGLVAGVGLLLSVRSTTHADQRSSEVYGVPACNPDDEYYQETGHGPCNEADQEHAGFGGPESSSTREVNDEYYGKEGDPTQMGGGKTEQSY